MINQIKSFSCYAALGRHFGINESLVGYKTKKTNVRMTAAVDFNQSCEEGGNFQK